MLKITFFTVLLLFSKLTVLAQWQQVTVFNTTEKIQNIDVVDQSVIWALSFGTTTYIYRSVNSGLNWSSSGTIPEVCYFIKAVNSTTAWVSTGSGNIYKTTNGGLNWFSQTYSPKNFINRIHFFDANTGYFLADAVNDTVGFFYTRNGGNTWIRSSKAPVDTTTTLIVENCANQLDTNFIWFCGHNGGTNYKFYKLTGGFEAEWQILDYSQPGSFRFAVFKDNQYGIAASYQGGLIFTTNGGMNWQFKNTAQGSGMLYELINVPGNNWIVALRGNTINLSKDLCNTWFSSYTIGSSAGYGDAYDTTNIWLSYVEGKLLKYNFLEIGLININNTVPENYYLFQNYPNPFNPVTKIRFALKNTEEFSVSIFDVLGKEVYNLKDFKPAGTYELEFNASELPSGIYFYRFNSANYSETKKMILIK